MNLKMNLKMNLEMIVAMNKDRVIGDKNNIPWYVPEDLMNFKRITSDGVVIMGRKTFESLPNGALKNRVNIVLTKKHLVHDNKNQDKNLIFTDLEHIPNILNEYQDKNKRFFIIGGAEIYKLFFDYCSIIHLTIIYNDFKGDTLFPYNIDIFKNKSLYENIYESDILFSKNKNIPYQYLRYIKK